MSEILADEPNHEAELHDVPAESASTDSGDPEVQPDPAPTPLPAPFEAAPPVYVPPPITPQADPSVSLDDFMQNLSRNDSRVSLVNAFAAQASVKHLNRATPAEFNAAYVAFCNAPA